jgi:hypothetical protein
MAQFRKRRSAPFTRGAPRLNPRPWYKQGAGSLAELSTYVLSKYQAPRRCQGLGRFRSWLLVCARRLPPHRSTVYPHCPPAGKVAAWPCASAVCAPVKPEKSRGLGACGVPKGTGHLVFGGTRRSARPRAAERSVVAISGRKGRAMGVRAVGRKKIIRIRQDGKLLCTYGKHWCDPSEFYNSKYWCRNCHHAHYRLMEPSEAYEVSLECRKRAGGG